MKDSSMCGARLLPIAALALLSLIWGYNWVVMKVALSDCPPCLFAALRALIGAAILLPLRPPAPVYLIPLGLLQTTGFVGFTLWALEYGGAGKTAILVYMMPIWLILIAWPVLNERLRGLQWPALGLAMGGLILILEPWRYHTKTFGAILALAASFSWAASAIWQKRMGGKGFDLLNVTAWQMLVGGLALAVIAFSADPVRIHWTPAFLAALAYNAVPGNALAWLLWTYALHKLSAGVAGMGTLITPLIGVMAAWLQLGEQPGGWEGLGMLCIFLALALVSWQHLRPREMLPLPAAQE